MIVSDLLAMLRNDVLGDRSDRVAGTPDYLWSDATLLAFMDDAHKRFARGALCIRDSSSDVTQVQLQTGLATYALDPSIIAVMSVRNPNDTADLARGGHSAFDTYRQPDSYYFDPSQLSSMPDGKPLAFSTDEELQEDDYGSRSVVTLRIYPKPSSTYNALTLNMRVIRMPTMTISSANLSYVPEIPEAYHIDMLDWAAYRALRIVDHDAGNPQRAQEFKAAFEENVKRARNEAMRKMFTPAAWGFGRNAFSWVRDAY